MRKLLFILNFGCLPYVVSSPDIRFTPSMYRGNHSFTTSEISNHFRNYDAFLTANEKKDITYIISYTSVEPWWVLLQYQTMLNEAGDRIYHVHPLRFLMYVFKEEELKEGVKLIYKRGIPVWPKFINGLTKSLKEEYLRGNLRDDQLAHFADAIGVDIDRISPFIRKNKWTDFVVYLIKNVP